MILHFRIKAKQHARNYYFCRIASLSIALFAPATLAADTAPTANNTIVLWHWWNSKGERKSVDVLNTYLALHGLQLADEQAKAASTGLYLRNFQNWLKTSKRPDAAMMVSSDIHTPSLTGSLLSLDDIAFEQGWSEFIPSAIQDTAKNQGHWVSAPINSHSTNWIWVNKALFSQLDLPEPETWEDLLKVLKRAKELGIPALVSLDNDWEQALLFELLVISTGGLEFYRRLFVNSQIKPGDQHTLIKAFLRLKQLTHYFTTSTKNMAWNQSTALVAEGKVLMQIHGSWVNSELVSLGKKADIDYLCMRFPDTQGAYLFHSDHFVFFKNTSGNPTYQKQLARIILGKEFQRELSIASGAAPVRVDISTKGFNSCAKKSMHDLRMANMRRAVMASINNKYLFKIVNDYLSNKISVETAAKQVIDAYTPFAKGAPNSIETPYVH